MNTCRCGHKGTAHTWTSWGGYASCSSCECISYRVPCPAYRPDEGHRESISPAQEAIGELMS